MVFRSGKSRGDSERLRELLDSMTEPAELFVEEEKGAVRCLACAHRCRLAPGKRGFCRIRFNEGGQLMTPWNYTAGVAVDPVEKKPLYHVLPGSNALSYGMLGCNFRCDFCQNWCTSQVLRDEDVTWGPFRTMSAEEIVEMAIHNGAPILASTYNEPLISAEWSHAIMGPARERGICTAFISNGFATEETLEYMRPVLDVYKVDLKTMQDRNYRSVGGRLEPVLNTIRRAKGMGYWVEVVTLVIPGFNDSDGELADMAGFIAGVSPDIPWHVTAFHPDYRETTGIRPTAPDDIVRAARAGTDAGLHYVYAGNLPGALAEMENTRCPGCGTTVIERRGFRVLSNRMGSDGKCQDCGHSIAGIWK